MSKEQVILQVLHDAGILERVREKVKDDAELVELFDRDFEGLIAKIGG